MVKPRFIIIILVCLITLVGCSKGKISTEDGYDLTDINKVFESQGLKLSSYGITGSSPILNNIVPEVNSIENESSVDLSDPEFVYLYTFNNEDDRKSGKKEFEKQMKNAKFTVYPFLYEKGNLLIIYWAKSRENPAFDDKIKLVIEKL